MNIVTWIILGLIAGVVANALFPENAKGGIVSAILLGIAGAVVGGFLGGMFLGTDVSGINFPSIIISIGGALLLLFAGRYINRT